jgi:hypothetical protein
MKAAVAIWCDVASEVREEFDDWHAHEHMPERLSIPGFLRGSRWVAADGGSGYFMLYEAQDESTITAGPYLERLNNPTPWSRKMMPHHRNMVRGLCRVERASSPPCRRAKAWFRRICFGTSRIRRRRLPSRNCAAATRRRIGSRWSADTAPKRWPLSQVN